MLLNLRLVVVFLSFAGGVFVAPSGNAQQGSQSVTEKFRLIEGGRFVQGTTGGERVLQRAFPLSTTGQAYGNAESPAHVTWITNPFSIATTEVTVGQFRAFVQATGYRTSAERGESEMVGWQPTSDDKPLYQSHDFLRDAKFNWRNPGFDQTDNCPVVGVSYVDAKAYCRWLSGVDGETYRLPSEAEWEFVCRAGTSTWFSFGDRAKGTVHQHANLGNVELEKHRKHAAERQWLLDWENDPEDGFVFTAPVGSFKPNPWGIHDMHGNVWEWCEDLWLDTVYKDYSRPRFDQPCKVAVDPVNLDRPQTATNDFHTIRGGSWYNGDLQTRSANRAFWDAQDSACYIGFRIVREADPKVSTTASDAYESEQAAIDAARSAGGNLYSSNGTDLKLRLEGGKFDETVFVELSKLSDLRGLQIGWRDRDATLSQSSLNAIADLRGLQKLEFQTGLNVQSLDLSVLSRLPQLQVLRFPRDAPLGDQQLALLSNVKSLIEFQCFGTAGGLSDVGIACLSGNRELRVLQVWENDANGSFLAALFGCPLRSLACSARERSEGRFTDANALNLTHFPELRSLDLSDQATLGTRALESIGRLSELRELNLNRCSGIVDDSFVDLAELKKLQRVNLLDTAAGAAAVGAIAQVPRIREVRLGGESDRSLSVLHDRDVKVLAQAFSITELELNSDRISDQGIKHLGRINQLRKLTLTSNQITGAGLGPLTRMPNLNDLSLRTSGLTDVAFEYLSAAKSVVKLRLAHRGYQPPASITDQGVMKMSQAKWMKEIWLPRRVPSVGESTDKDLGINEQAISELDELMPSTNVIAYTVIWDH